MNAAPPAAGVSPQHDVVLRVRRGMRSAGVSPDAHIVAAVSGGRDSMALLVALAALGGPVVVAHVHHHRRAEADIELERVRTVTSRFGMTFECAHLDGDPSATPADLRAARYAALIDIARSHKSSLIATGHQAEDQLETILLAMIRGAGPRGLVGMRMRRPLCEGIDVFRPMLEVRRGSAQQLCEEANVEWCDDPTNEDPSTLRGLLRREVVPAMESIRAGAAQRISEATPLRQSAADALDAAVRRPVEGRWPRADLAAMTEGLRIASIHLAAVAACGGADAVSSACVRDASAAITDTREHRRTFELGGGVVCVVEAKWVRLEAGSDLST